MISKPKSETKKKSRKPIKRVSSRGTLVKKAHAILRDIVIKRDRGCVCPSPEKGHSSIIQAGHLIPSTKGSVRFDLRNVAAQCFSCNGRHRFYPHYYTHWFILKFGEEYNRLCADSEGIGLKRYELEEMIVQLTEIKSRQEADENFIPRFTQREILSGAWK
jgi:hypothetical protein